MELAKKLECYQNSRGYHHSELEEKGKDYKAVFTADYGHGLKQYAWGYDTMKVDANSVPLGFTFPENIVETKSWDAQLSVTVVEQEGKKVFRCEETSHSVKNGSQVKVTYCQDIRVYVRNVTEVLSDKDIKDLAPFCSCEICTSWNPITKALACPCCFGCLKSGKASQSSIDEARESLKSKKSWRSKISSALTPSS